MLRLLVVIAVSAFLFSSCNERKGFEITGKFQNAKGRMVYLNMLTPDKLVKIDSATINDDGNFIFDGSVSFPTFYMLNLSKNEFLYLLIDSMERISINADASNLHKTYRIEGSEGSMQLREMHLHLLTALDRMDSLGAIYRNFYDTPKIDSVTAELNKVSAGIYQSEKAYLNDFIKRYEGSMSTYMALNQQLSPKEFILSPEEDFQTFKSVDSVLSARYPASPYVKALSSYISQVSVKIKEKAASEARLAQGQKAPDISLNTPDGKLKSLYSITSDYILLDFWASWCAPCRKENPALVDCYKKFHAKGFDIFQVSLDKNAADWKEAITKDNLTWHHVSDLSYWDSPVVKLFAIRAIPSNLLLDKDKKIIARNIMGKDLENKLKELTGK